MHICCLYLTIAVQSGAKLIKRYINKILILQNRAAKLILDKPIRTPTDGRFKHLKWLTFTDSCKYHTAILVYKTLNYMAHSCMSDIITVSTNNSYSLRSVLRNNLVLKHKPKTKYIKDSFNYYSMTVWNEILIEIRTAANIQSLNSCTRSICLILHDRYALISIMKSLACEWVSVNSLLFILFFLLRIHVC